MGGAIDVVITWVDGDDPVHRFGRAEALAAADLPQARRLNGTEETRFANSGEIYYSIASILKYAPFVRRIFIVTDNQVPPHLEDFTALGICDPGRIQVVDHRTIFAGYEEYLPTYNSLTIETMIWRIPGLSETFLYLNDDVFLNAPLSPADLVTDEGKLVIHGELRSVYPLLLKGLLRRIRTRYRLTKKSYGAHFKTAQVLSARLCRLSRYIQVGHTPHVLRRSVFEAFFRSHPDAVHRQIAPRFRTIEQFLPVGLSHHAGLAAGTVELRPLDSSAYLKPSNSGEERLNVLRREGTLYGCAQSLERFSADRRRLFRSVMHAKLEGFLPASVCGHLEWLDARRTPKPASGETARLIRVAA
ncbi:Stealth CR1 domain-containing protein [Chelativorans composti]|jgi:Protein of unknown function (DUF3184).|uniref:Stealth family protein n=1 Tax=Chelativorans composti TaxID=768533 RepID=A0ABW5DJR9_9HYPH